MKHSPTPWTIERTSDQVTIVAADGYNILSIPIDPEYGRPDEDEANARLMEAAPEILDALRLIEHQIGALKPDASTLIYVRAAIARAEGRS